MLTSPDDPYVVLPLLHSRGTALQGLLSGYYKLTGDQVSLIELISLHICTIKKSVECCSYCSVKHYGR